MIEQTFGFEALELWKKARLFKNEIRKVTKKLPVKKNTD